MSIKVQIREVGPKANPRLSVSIEWETDGATPTTLQTVWKLKEFFCGQSNVGELICSDDEA